MNYGKKLLLVTALAFSAQAAQAIPALKPEMTPPPNEGAISTDDLGPVYSRPFEEPKETTGIKAPAEVSKEEPKRSNEVLTLFTQEKPQTPEKNPLEEDARKELQQAMTGDPENQSGAKALALGESNTFDIKPEMSSPEDPNSVELKKDGPKEVELGDNMEANDLPKMLR